MGKVIVSAQMTLDGVIDRVDEWFSGDGETAERSFDELRSADALLLGRETYQGLARVWPTITDTSGFADLVNSRPKYVASRTLTGALDWNATVLDGDVAHRVSELKDRLTGTLLSYGCGMLAHYLIGQGLVDEFVLWLHPIGLGSGVRPFDTGGPVKLRLIETATYRSGVVLLRYEPL
ncbi:MAG: bifunctional deaminase-reductase domain protein [Pseudonocardiales bacterium]|nr:bifunctional deaminase-reductase domain protein [Pseudonocardiales bacterium]